MTRCLSSQTHDLWHTSLMLVVLVILLAAAPPALSQPGGGLRSQMAQGAGPGRGRPSEDKRLPPNVAPGEAAQRASREYGGRVLNVVLEDGPGGPYYRVKLLDGGRVRVVHVEARH